MDRTTRIEGKDAVLRHYRDEDYDALCDFLLELNRNERLHINWNWARFEWMAEHPEFDRNARETIGLWICGERVVGAAIYDMYFGEAFCGTLSDYSHLYPEILDYAWREFRDEKGLGIAVNDTNSFEIKEALKRGFVPSEQAETLLRMDLTRPLPVELPERLSIAELDPAKEPYEIQWLLWQGFDHGEDREEFEREGLIVPGVRKHMNPYLSLTARDPMGRPVSCCCLWFYEGSDYAYLEPVCTIPAWRGKGAAGALIYEGMNRARSLGAKSVYVISDMEFYKHLGFQRDSHYTFYWKT